MTAPGDTPSTPSDRVGEIVSGRYRIVRLLGIGGMGAVYEVEHIALRRAFALKLLVAGEDDARGLALARFQQEAGVVAALRHPNIVEIVDWLALDEGTPGMLMEFLDGDTMRERVQQGPLPWPSIARFGDQLLSALAVAHKAGIIHRDLKPANLFIVRDEGSEERLKLLDFGVSKIQRSGHDLTAAGYVLGTPPYMSPEQMRAGKLTPAADLWSAGVLLYEMTTARRPFEGRSLRELSDRIRSGPARPITELRPDAPAALQELLSRALTIDPARRIGSAVEMRTALAVSLKTLLRSLPSGAIDLTVAPLSASPSHSAPIATPPTAPVPEATAVTRDLRAARDAPEAATADEVAPGVVELDPTPALADTEPSSRPVRRPIALGVLGLVALGVAVGALYASSPPTTPGATVAAEAPPPSLETPPVADLAERAASSAPAAAPPRGAALLLEGLPLGAHVYLDDRLLDGAPERPGDDKRHILKIVAVGYLPAILPLDHSTRSPLAVHLQRRRAAPASGKADAPNQPPILDP